jgi:hypothetical protein
MRYKFIVAFILIGFSGIAFSQDIKIPDLRGFKKTTGYPVYAKDNLWDYLGSAADTYLSYGFVNMHVAEFKKGKNIIKLEIYKHSDNNMAFGIYSSERSASFKFVKLGSQGYISSGIINFFRGSFYVKIKTFSKNERVLKSAESLAHEVDDQIQGGAEMPSALSLFPLNGRKVNQETYINESVLGHKFLNKAFKADYESGNETFSLFLLESTPRETQKSVDAYLAATGTEPVDAEIGKYMLKDGNNGTIFLAWKGNRILILSGLSIDQSAVADKYISEIFK